MSNQKRETRYVLRISPHQAKKVAKRTAETGEKVGKVYLAGQELIEEQRQIRLEARRKKLSSGIRILRMIAKAFS